MLLKMKFSLSFGAIALLVMTLVFVVTSNVNKISDNFTEYKKVANETVLASRVESNMLMVRMNVKDYLLTNSSKEIEEFKHYYNKTVGFVDNAIQEMHQPSAKKQINTINTQLHEYKENFEKVVDYYQQRNEIVSTNLDINGKKIEKLLTSVMMSAEKDNDVQSSLDTAKSIRILLLARLYTNKFLITNSQKELKRVQEEFNHLRKYLQITRNNLENRDRKKQLQEAIVLIKKYKRGVRNVSEIIIARNNLIKNKLDVIGPKVASLAENIKLTMKKYKNKLGAEISENNQAIKSTVYIIGFSLVSIILFLSYYMISVMLMKPLSKLQNVTKDLAQGDGNLTQRLKESGKDEISLISQYINKFIEKVQLTIIEVKESASENALTANDLSLSAAKVGNNVEETVIIVKETTFKAQKVGEEITNSIVTAKKSKEDILHANDNLNEAKKDIIALTSKVQETAQTEAELSENMEMLSKDASEVKTILVVIADIADQTNLLALNAAIEAARAGEHGRGFAVVADEVRKLAERTQKSLTEINATINIVVQAIIEASSRMSNNSQEIQELAHIAESVESKINSTVDIVNKAVYASESTVNDFEQTGENINTIISQVEKVNVISETNATNVEEIAAAAESLNNKAKSLNIQLETFRT